MIYLDIKGMNSKVKSLQTSKNISLNELKTYNTVLNYKMKELQQYIGTPSEQNDIFRFTSTLDDGNIDTANVNLEFLNDQNYIPATYFIPDTEEKLYNDGAVDIISDVATYTDTESTLSAAATAAVTYNKIAARDYANKWTNNNGGNDPSTYNNAVYANYAGNDCANYVSQAMYAGGIPQDSTWKPGSTAWTNTGLNVSGGLQDYMLAKGYFKKATKSTTGAGGFIYTLSYSHVMMVVSNDTVTMLYSAHTNDRKQASFASFGSDFEFYAAN